MIALGSIKEISENVNEDNRRNKLKPLIIKL